MSKISAQHGPPHHLIRRIVAGGGLVLLEAYVLVSEMIAINPTWFARYPNAVSLLTFVLPSILGAITESPWVATVLGPIPFVLVLGVYWVLFRQFPSFPPAALAVVVGLFAILSVLGWLVRRVLPDVLRSPPNEVPNAARASGEQRAHRRGVHGGTVVPLTVGCALLAESIGLLNFELFAAPPSWILPFARNYSPLTILLTVLTALTPFFAVVVGMLAHRIEAAILLAALPFWLLIAVYLALFAPSWYLDLQGLSNLTERIVLTTFVCGILGAVGWRLGRFFRRHGSSDLPPNAVEQAG